MKQSIGEGRDAKIRRIGNVPQDAFQKTKMAFDIAGRRDYLRHPFSNRKPTTFHHAYD
jgi:hypothetical protein